MSANSLRRIRKASWENIKAEYEDGITADDLAVKWRIKAGTIRCRASRENWATPHRVKAAIESVVAMVQGSSASKQAFESLNATVATNGCNTGQMQHGVATGADPADYQAFVAELAMRAVRNGLGKVKAPANWREIATADTVARRALGLDSKGGASATAMVRVTGPAGQTVDVMAGASVERDDSEEDWDD